MWALLVRENDHDLAGPGSRGGPDRFEPDEMRGIADGLASSSVRGSDVFERQSDAVEVRDVAEIKHGVQLNLELVDHQTDRFFERPALSCESSTDLGDCGVERGGEVEGREAVGRIPSTPKGSRPLPRDRWVATRHQSVEPLRH